MFPDRAVFFNDCVVLLVVSNLSLSNVCATCTTIIYTFKLVTVPHAFKPVDSVPWVGQVGIFFDHCVFVLLSFLI